MRLLLFAVIGAAPATAGEIALTMAGSEYAPTVVEASVGDVLRFVNDDATDHNVFVPTAGFAFDLGKQEPGSETSYILGKPGVFEVECVLHDFMLARVEVSQ